MLHTTTTTNIIYLMHPTNPRVFTLCGDDGEIVDIVH